MKEFLDWSHIPEHIDPTLFTVGPIEVRWYGIMYVLAFLAAYLLIVYRIKTEKLKYKKKTIGYILILGIFTSVICGRLGYVLLYNFRYFWANPLKIFFPFEVSSGFKYTGLSGLSYHGGLAGILLLAIPIAKRKGINYWHLGDIIASAVPLGYTLGRLANFINGELYGRITTSSLGMYFPSDPTHQLRHPSQLYEALFEGVLLFVILWSLRKVKLFDGFLCSLYFIGYGLARFFIEFVRQPDAQLGFILGRFTMGQILCVGMMLGGLILALIKLRSGKIGRAVSQLTKGGHSYENEEDSNCYCAGTRDFGCDCTD